eukprot:135994-Rhodomonas_salina.4
MLPGGSNAPGSNDPAGTTIRHVSTGHAVAAAQADTTAQHPTLSQYRASHSKPVGTYAVPVPGIA